MAMPRKGVVVAVIKKSLLKLSRHSGNPCRNDVGIANLKIFPKDDLVFKAHPLSLQALTAAALILPGLFQPIAQATEEDNVDFQYSHYQEGRREGINRVIIDTTTGNIGKYAVANKRNPIEVDSLHGSARVTLTDRVKFAFNYIEDTWAGATPLASAPEGSGANGRGTLFPRSTDTPALLLTGASPYAASSTILDSQGQAYYALIVPQTGQTSFIKDRTVHVMSYASPETRKQGDFKLDYEWDEAALNIGGGISSERDYESRFINLSGRKDFNQKQTTINAGLSYTNSAISAVLYPSVAGTYFTWSNQHQSLISKNSETGLYTLNSNREDWSGHVDLTQVINKNALTELGMSYTRSTGFLENPYKLSWMFGVNPDHQLPNGFLLANALPFIEQRPDVRNQWNWNALWIQYVPPMDAVLHLDYQFAHDDWGINAHTFSAEWAQPVGSGWTVTPQVRYYSQDAANFYQPYFIVPSSVNTRPVATDNHLTLPDNFSSDQRLSAFGTLSGGITVSKIFAKGVRLETGFEYYTHQGGLKLGGGGEQAFANFDYWVANAALKINLSSLDQSGSGAGVMDHNHQDHANIPSGVLFAHTLDKAGDMMVGYRYMKNMQDGGFLQKSNKIDEQLVMVQGCPGSSWEDNDGIIHDGCTMLPQSMNMNMHMLELMVAPTDWLTLMLMPQFADMSMTMTPHVHHGGGHAVEHEEGGIGDTGLYALVKLFDRPRHHLHISVGVSAPTGDVSIKNNEGTKNWDGSFVGYGMQLGSGTWDFKPSLTYTGKAADWSWGGQVGGTKRLEHSNGSGYALGDLFESSLWGGYDLTHWLSASVRATYTWQGNIKGRYPRSNRFDSQLITCNAADYIYVDDLNGDGIPDGAPFLHQADYSQCLADVEDQKRFYDARDRSSTTDFPSNYGGHYVDIGLGLSAVMPGGAFAGNRLSFEWLQPVYTNVNGYQLDRNGALSFTWSYGF